MKIHFLSAAHRVSDLL